MPKFGYLGLTVTNQNYIHDAIERKINSSHDFYPLLRVLIFSGFCLKFIISRFVSYGCEIWFLAIREEHLLSRFQNKELDLREKVQQMNVGNCITKILIFYTLLKILLGRSNQKEEMGESK